MAENSNQSHRFKILYFVGVSLSLATYAWLLIAGVQDAITYQSNMQLTILAAIALVGSYVKLPQCFFSKTGTLREQILFFGIHTLQALGLILNVLAFRKDYMYISYILSIIILIFYLINCILFIPKFKFFNK